MLIFKEMQLLPEIFLGISIVYLIIHGTFISVNIKYLLIQNLEFFSILSMITCIDADSSPISKTEFQKIEYDGSSGFHLVLKKLINKKH